MLGPFFHVERVRVASSLNRERIFGVAGEAHLIITRLSPQDDGFVCNGPRHRSTHNYYRVFESLSHVNGHNPNGVIASFRRNRLANPSFFLLLDGRPVQIVPQ